MSKQDLKSKLQSFDPEHLMRWLAWILAVAAAGVASVFVLYFMHFHTGFSSDPGRWGTFGDFIGGTLNPILSFMALIALLLTVVLQSRQADISKNELELSRKELEATRQELAGSAAAQEKTEKAQLKQAVAQEIAARVAAISQLLQQEEEVISRITTWSEGSAKAARRQAAVDNKRELVEELRLLYQRLGSVDDQP